VGINNLPASLQSIIQQNFLAREFEDMLKATLGFRNIADRDAFKTGMGETITRLRPGLLSPNTKPLPPAANGDFTSGLSSQNYSTEQYTVSINPYGTSMYLNLATSAVAIADQYLLNAKQLAENAARTLDILAQQALYGVVSSNSVGGYMGGNTRVNTTLAAAGTTIAVDDIRGFTNTLNTLGQIVPVSSSYPVNVTVGADIYSLVGYTADSTNVSTAPGGVSGTLTFSSSVSIADGTAGNAVVSVVAPTIFRPSTNNNPAAGVSTTAGINSSLANSGRLTMQMILAAKAQLRNNAVPMATDTGSYILYSDPTQLIGLYQDPAFQQFFRGQIDTAEYKKGVVAEMLGVRIVETNINPLQASLGSGPIHRSLLCGQGALIEGAYTPSGYAAELADVDSDMITTVDAIAHITREPLDALKQVVTQSWYYAGGFCTPTDSTANATTIPTATNSLLKRAVMLESL